MNKMMADLSNSQWVWIGVTREWIEQRQRPIDMISKIQVKTKNEDRRKRIWQAYNTASFSPEYTNNHDEIYLVKSTMSQDGTQDTLKT